MSAFLTYLDRLARDVWGRPKAIADYSLFNAKWSLDIPARVWEERDVATTEVIPGTGVGTYSSITNGTLNLATGGILSTRRFFGYQPNRGAYYAASAFFPDPTNIGTRKLGLFTSRNGVYFELEGTGDDWQLYAVRLSGNVVQSRTALNIPGFDPSKGHTYDIQFQWRGVGNYYFFVDLQLVHTEELLGTLASVSMEDPSLPIAFSCDTASAPLQLGCVDLSSEGGREPERSFLTASTGEELIVVDDKTATIAIRVPRMLSPSIYNTRPLNIARISSWTRDESVVIARVAKDVNAPAMEALPWITIPDSQVEYIIGGEGSELAAAFTTDEGAFNTGLIEWSETDTKNNLANPAELSAPFFAVPGSLVVITVDAVVGNNVDNHTTIYMSEEL